MLADENMWGGGFVVRYYNILLGWLWDRAIKQFERIFLHIFVTVMPHFVIYYIQDETYVKLRFFSENMYPSLEC